MFETSQREAFCDAMKALKSVYGRSSAPELTGEAQDAPSDPVNDGWRRGIPLPSVPDMTYNVFGGTLSLAQSIYHPRTFALVVKVDSRLHIP